MSQRGPARSTGAGGNRGLNHLTTNPKSHHPIKPRARPLICSAAAAPFQRSVVLKVALKQPAGDARPLTHLSSGRPLLWPPAIVKPPLTPPPLSPHPPYPPPTQDASDLITPGRGGGNIKNPQKTQPPIFEHLASLLSLPTLFNTLPLPNPDTTMLSSSKAMSPPLLAQPFIDYDDRSHEYTFFFSPSLTSLPISTPWCTFLFSLSPRRKGS